MSAQQRSESMSKQMNQLWRVIVVTRGQPYHNIFQRLQRIHYQFKVVHGLE